MLYTFLISQETKEVNNCLKEEDIHCMHSISSIESKDNKGCAIRMTDVDKVYNMH